MKIFLACAVGGALPFLLCQPGWAQMPALREMGNELHVQVRLDPTGEATLGAWTRNGNLELAPVLPQVLGCRSGVKKDENGGNAIRCSRASERDGLTLKAVLDLAPIARRLNPATPIELWVNLPALGFESVSVPMTEEPDGLRITRTARFEPVVAPEPIVIRFGYEPGRLLGIYLPLLALALVITGLSAAIARAGFAPLAFSETMLGTMVWMCACAQLQADVPLRILLLGDRLAEFAALFVDLWPPLFCVAIGVAIGSRMRGSQPRRARFGEVVGAYAIVPLILTCVTGMLPSISDNDWLAVAAWVAAAPAILLARRAWNRARARASVKLLTAGELKERLSALAAKAGWRQLKIYISYSTRSQTANAFALPGRSIFLTASLVRSLNKREVDAVGAHELSHSYQANRGVWMALCMAMLFCETPAREFAYLLPGGLYTAMAVPIAVYLASLYGSRSREFTADAYSAALTGDPRSMISALAKVGRSNGHPLDMPPMLEWFSSHPATRRRIKALAASGRVEAAEVETLTNHDQPGEHYEVAEGQDGREVFTLAWQRTNAGIFSWTVILCSGGAGLVVAWIAQRITGFGIESIVGGLVLGCLLTKGAAAYVMSRNYARLRRELETKLGAEGQLVGLAPEGRAGIYNSFRFSDAGLLRFDHGRLCYRSERTTIALNAADVQQVGMVAAAPSNWFRRQPMVEFRDPQSGQSHAFILHTLGWLATQRKLFGSIKRWKATAESQEPTMIAGFNPAAGQPFDTPGIASLMQGLLVTSGIALVAAIVACLALRADSRYIVFALAITACDYISMLLPAMTYRTEAGPGDAAPASEGK